MLNPEQEIFLYSRVGHKNLFPSMKYLLAVFATFILAPKIQRGKPL